MYTSINPSEEVRISIETTARVSFIFQLCTEWTWFRVHITFEWFMSFLTCLTCLDLVVVGVVVNRRVCQVGAVFEGEDPNIEPREGLPRVFDRREEEMGVNELLHVLVRVLEWVLELDEDNKVGEDGPSNLEA